jgi:hypothetical protein
MGWTMSVGRVRNRAAALGGNASISAWQIGSDSKGSKARWSLTPARTASASSWQAAAVWRSVMSTLVEKDQLKVAHNGAQAQEHYA